METENKILWKSRTSGHLTVTLLLSSLAVLIAALLSMVAFSSKDSDTLKIIMIVVVGLILIASIVEVCLARLSDLKWNVSNLIFLLSNSGLYFTGVVNQDSYFYAEWSEIVGYSVKMNKKGKATVKVSFNCIQNAGSFGKIKYVKMVGVSEVEEMCKVFESFGINQTDLSKN